MCGVIGVLLADHSEPAVAELLEGCHYLQHRGQDAAGITTCGPGGRLFQCKGNGLARDVFLPKRVSQLYGSMGIAHLRYPTAGTSSNSEAQPFYVNSPYGLVMAHNGNLINSVELKNLMDEVYHRHINTDSDSELLLNLFAARLQETNKRRINEKDLVSAIQGVYEACDGAYACTALLAGYGILGFRDPHGIRPLSYGNRKNKNGGVDHMFASEDIVLQALGYSNIRDVKPGECIIARKGDSEPFCAQIIPQKAYAPCIFEYVYFARPDSIMDGISVYRSRIAMGEALARNVLARFGSIEALRANIDVVIPVPDTSNPAALALATYLNIPYREGFVKNRYVGRTFIMPNQSERRSSVRRKLNANRFEFHNNRVLLVDDSIVRGTTSKEIVQMAREAGAKAVHFASCAPPIRNNHIYGIDLADSRALVAFQKSEDEICKIIGCDSLYYQSIEDLAESIRSVAINPEILTGFEIGVFTGHYITGVPASYSRHLEELRTEKKENGFKSDTDIGIYNHGETA